MPEVRLRREISDWRSMMQGRFVYIFLSEIDQWQNKCKCSEHVLEMRSHARLCKGCGFGRPVWV